MFGRKRAKTKFKRRWSQTLENLWLLFERFVCFLPSGFSEVTEGWSTGKRHDESCDSETCFLEV